MCYTLSMNSQITVVPHIRRYERRFLRRKVLIYEGPLSQFRAPVSFGLTDGLGLTLVNQSSWRWPIKEEHNPPFDVYGFSLYQGETKLGEGLVDEVLEVWKGETYEFPVGAIKIEVKLG